MLCDEKERMECGCYGGGHQGGLQKMKIKVHKTIKQFMALLSLSQAEGSLSISLRSTTEDYVLTVDIQNDKLPLAFMNIFENVTDLFNFIKDAGPGAMDLVGTTLKLMVKAGVRLREVPIELARTQVPREELLERRLDKVEQSSKTFLTATHLQKETQRLLQEFTKKTIRPLTDEIKKLSERVVVLERQQEQKPKPSPSALFGNDYKPTFYQTIPKPAKNGSSEEPPKTSGPSDKLTRTDSPASGTQVGNHVGATENAGVRRPAKDFVFDIDLNNKYLDEFFTISGNRVTRKKDNQEIYMFSSSNPIPPTDRHCVNFKIEKISEGLIWVGLLAQHKKREQYIGEEPGILQFSLEGNKVLIDGKSFGLNIPEFKDGQLLSMEVEIPARKLRFYRNGKPNPLVKITIPENLALAKLYPYVQLISSGDTIVLL